MDYVSKYLTEVKEIANNLDKEQIEKMAEIISGLKKNGGRLFFLGVGGGAGNASHAVNDFRKIAGIESYSPSDNVSELTARINDDGWETSYVNWLRGSRLKKEDCIFVFSVGGGNEEKNLTKEEANQLLKMVEDKDKKVKERLQQQNRKRVPKNKDW